MPENETVRFTLYRLLQELLNNICKHAGASEVRIVLRQQGDMLHLDVSDNGVGISADKIAGFGIQGMRERVSALGGELALESRHGTRVLTCPQICNKSPSDQEKVLVTPDFLSSPFGFSFL